ncbi:hypothetical protein BCR39DRAFT_538316 [Naematelia encephala]|uniref:Cyclase-domain-containing protein n=1 Tax=Naematelia encephala TaxID=71784 RepID=A0A1Y2AXL8_9TREE|nr:hypothetical protein BCR39DRAFT_538316 [Naematelia encephala]
MSTEDTSTSPLSISHLSTSPDHPLSSWPSIPPSPRGRSVLLTPSIVSSASENIITGQRFALDWPVYPSVIPLYGRMKAEHTVKRVDPRPSKSKDEAEEKGEIWQPCFDDFVHINTQGTTQWDYFLHFSYPHSGLFYGGLTAQEILDEKTGEIGVAAIAKAGGIQTRGILVDLPLFLSETGQEPHDPLKDRVEFTTLLSALEHFKLDPQVGDVLLLRLGFEDAILQDIERVAAGHETRLKGKWSGMIASHQLAKWIWSKGIIAVATDNPTFEEWPAPDRNMSMHPILLSGMGIMIGELLRLKSLAEECKKQDRWSFWFTSCPLMIEHGVASPPNAVAIL